MPKRYEYKREPLTAHDCNKLQNECETLKEKLIIWTLLDTGLRIEEFCNMDKKNIDWTNHTITVWGKNTSGEGGKKRRTVPMSERIRRMLEVWIAENDGINIAIRTAQKIVKKVANRACIGKCSPHVLRHTFAVNSLQRGIPLDALSKILGHSDTMITSTYLNLSNAEALRLYKERW